MVLLWPTYRLVGARCRCWFSQGRWTLQSLKEERRRCDLIGKWLTASDTLPPLDDVWVHADHILCVDICHGVRHSLDLIASWNRLRSCSPPPVPEDAVTDLDPMFTRLSLFYVIELGNNLADEIDAKFKPHLWEICSKIFKMARRISKNGGKMPLNVHSQ